MAKQTRIHPLACLNLAPRHLRAGIGLAVLSLAAGVPGAGAQSSPSASGGGVPAAPAKAARVPNTGCLIGPERVTDIGTPVTGLIASIKVDRGDAVKKGETLVVLESTIEQAGVQAAQFRAAVDADIRAADANLLLTQQKLKRLEGLVEEGFVTKQAIEQGRAERDVAQQRLAQARAQQVVQAQELGVVRAQLGQRTLRSPFAGVVIERFANAGERAEDKPLLRVAQLDPLRVELVVPASRWGSIAKGDKLPIVPELPGATALLARVSHVDKIIDAGSNTFRVRLALPNPGHKLPAGARCKLDGPAAGAAASASPATPSAPAASSAQALSASARLPDNAAQRPSPKTAI